MLDRETSCTGNRLQRFAVFAVCVALLLVCVVGCGTRRASQQREESNLKPLALLYGQYTGQHQGRPPANEAEFKQFIESLPKEQLASFGVDDPESLFISDRDNKPYVIIYGQATNPAGPGDAPVIAYEQEGKNGKRFVATAIGSVEEVDEERFRQLVPDAP